MQGRSKPNSNPNNSYTSHSASTIYNNKVHQALPLSPSRVQQISHSWSKHKILAPALFLSKNWGKEKRFQKKMRNFVGAFDCIDKLNLPCDSHLHNKNNYLPTFLRLPKQSQQQRKRKGWRNVTIWQSAISGGNSVFTGLASTFHTSTKRRLLSCAKAIIAVFFALFATGCTRYEYIHLIDEDEEYNETPSDTTSHDSINIGFTFNPNDDDTIEVDLNPHK